MSKQKISKFVALGATASVVISSFGAGGVVSAASVDETTNTNQDTQNIASQTKVSTFPFYTDKDSLNLYNAKFKVDTANIELSNNGGSYNAGSQLKNVFDGDPNTFWETSKQNNGTYTNNVTFTFKEDTEINRLIYAPRLVGDPGKGFPLEFEVQARNSSETEFQTIAAGKYSGNLRDAIEIQFPSQEVKEVKFVFKKANKEWASASEFMFYTKDEVAEKMDKLFTDSTHITVSNAFKSEQALLELEKEAKEHPFYEQQYKALIEDAKALLSAKEVEMVSASMQSFTHYNNAEYLKQFKVDESNIKNIKHNGSTYRNQVITNAIDGNVDTYFETSSGNTNTFNNTVEVEFNKAVEINRLVYGARKGDNKGFANTFDIYVSPTSTGDTYKLVSSGSQNTVAGLVEAQFNPTKAKRVKFVFKTSNQNWATLSELAFFTEDKVKDFVDKLFTDGSRSAISSEFKSEVTLTALEDEAKNHPLYESYLKERLDIAKQLLKGEVDLEGRVIKAEQNGNMVAHAKNNLKFGFGNNFQPTGLAAIAGDKLTVYVEADAGSPLPQLVISQQEGSFNNWNRTFALKPGKNEITVPKFNSGNWYNHEVAAGGTIYIHNPYTPEQQKTAPIIRIEGGERIPFLTEDTNPEEFKTFLTDYKARLDKDKLEHPNLDDRKLIDVVEVVSDHLVFTGTATGAYTAYIEQEYNPLDTVKDYNDTMDKIFKFYGLDGSSEKHDPKAIRENIRLMQPFGYMYAYTEHTGVQGDVMVSMLTGAVKTWGPVHEIGHRMDVNNRLWGESTNNMLAQYMSVDRGQIDQRIPYDTIYQRAFMDSSQLGTFTSQGYFLRLGAFWQLEMYHPGYWAEINKLYRERDMSVPNNNVKEDYFVRYSSEVIGENLTEFFAKHGFYISDETKEIVKDLPKSKKAWYLNNSVIGYEGNGLQEDTEFDLNISRNVADKTNTLTFAIDKQYANDLLGYEIQRDGVAIGFTDKGSFTDTNVDFNENYTYTVVPYDKKLNALNGVEIETFTPTLVGKDSVTLKLRQSFDAKDYVTALDYKGQNISDSIEIESDNVNLAKKGTYQVVYKVTNEGITTTKTMDVVVTSDFDYVTDLQEVTGESFSGWNGVRKNLAPQGTKITLLNNGLPVTYEKGLGAHANSQVVYDIEGKGYDTFESYIGIDQAMKGKPSSAKFEVWVDDELKYTSGVFGSNTNEEFVKVDVTGAKKVKLVTNDAGSNSNTSDHTVWADAKFTKDTSVPVITFSESFTSVNLKEDFSLLDGVTAFDQEDGDMKDEITIDDGGLSSKKPGLYNVKYTVTDEDGHKAVASKQVYVYSEVKYASDMAWEKAISGWKEVARNKSVENQDIKLLVNGVTKSFEKGIGTHADSEIVYNLEGQNLDYFEATIGVERSIASNNHSSIVYKILADGEEVYNSGLMTYNTPSKKVSIPVRDVQKLQLIVDDNNDKSSDHAAWADAKFYVSNGKPTLTIPQSAVTKVGEPIDLDQAYQAVDAEDGDITASVKVSGLDDINFDKAGDYVVTYTITDSDGNQVTENRIVSVVDMRDFHYLSDYRWKTTTNSYTAPKLNKATSGNDLRLTKEDGSIVTYTNGIGAHSTSTIVYDLTDKEAAYFTSYVGVDRQMYGSVGSVGFEVYVDGVKQFDSGVMTSTMPQKFVEVSLAGAKELKLVVTNGGNGQGSDHATWGDAKLHYANEDRVSTKALESAIEMAKNVDTEGFTPDSIETFQNALAKAETLFADTNATQSQLDAAVTELTQAKDGLQLIDLTKVINIADSELAKALKEQLHIQGDITLGDLYKLESLKVDVKGIRSLAGLEQAKNLTSLDISSNGIVDFSPLKHLKKLSNLTVGVQILEMGEFDATDNMVSIQNLAKTRNGDIVMPKSITYKKVGATEIKEVDTTVLAETPEVFNLDFAQEEKGKYWMTIEYEIEGSEVYMVYLVHHF